MTHPGTGTHTHTHLHAHVDTSGVSVCIGVLLIEDSEARDFTEKYPSQSPPHYSDLFGAFATGFCGHCDREH